MLSVFPTHFLSLFAYLILRVAVGLVLAYLGIQHWQHRHELQHVLRLSWWPFGRTTTYLFVLGELLLAGLILVGAWTQIATLCVAAMCIKMLVLRQYVTHRTIPSKLFYFLLLAASLTLTITGAGALAIDLPL